MKQAIKHLVERAPGPFPLATLEALRALRYPEVRSRQRLVRRLFAKVGKPSHIVCGPFAGMRYDARAYCSAILPKFLGTYELEIAPGIEAVAASASDVIVDIGAAEGYYAVGLALRVPTARLVAFEMYPPARALLSRHARRNGVADRVEIRGECTLDALAEALDGAERPAVVCDCEGAEDVLLDPDRIAALRRAIVLVESHEGMVAGVNDRLRDRFGASHDVTLIPSRPRTVADLPDGVALDPDEAAAAMDEQRDWAEWFLMTPKRSEHGPGTGPESSRCPSPVC
ncbi:MAG TPA: hypothetical protein VG406_26820 [Isosphaeraceae bacterium]|jgi:hypothetical protein|nr:hypothetical protein [Isosphaeraceae bacterium]